MYRKIIKSIFVFLLCFHFFIIDAKIVELDRCIDGDTARFFTSRGSESVRFLAIDTPETNHPQKGIEPFGQEASDFTCHQLKNANVIRLEFDDESDLYDRYNRLLAWIFVDDVLLQELIIEEGLGEVAYLYGNYKYTEILKLKEAEAKKNQIGIWQEQSDLDVFKIGTGTIAFMAIVNLLYFRFKASRQSYLSKIYQKDIFYIKVILIALYLLTVVLVVHDFALVAKDLSKYKKQIKT